MPKGWAVEVTVQHHDAWRPAMRRLWFDVAIEDERAAVEAVRQHTQTIAVSDISVLQEVVHSLSPGRIKSRRAPPPVSAQTTVQQALGTQIIP
jgi:hypothetical protein